MIWLYLLLIPPLGGLFYALYYWLIVSTEGLFFGRRFVVWLYDREAHKYDEIKEFTMDDERILVVDPILAECYRHPNPLLLDVATGTGRVPYFLFADGRFVDDLDGRVIALDPSKKMLEFGVDNLKKAPGPVSWVQQYADPLPFGDDVFDGVTCLEAVEFFPSLERGVLEMIRVCKPGGFVMITRRADWEARTFLGRHYDREGYRAMLTELGLTEVGVYTWEDMYDLVIARKP